MVTFSYLEILIIGIIITLSFVLFHTIIAEKFSKEREAELLTIWEEYLFIQSEKELANRLLLNVLPKKVAEKLLKNPTALADHFEDITILFADMVGFTKISSKISPTSLVNLLNDIFTNFDKLTDVYKLEKIKTIGDSYMAAGGLPGTTQNHKEAAVEMALAMQKILEKFNSDNNMNIQIRIGINSGPVVAGVIGIKKFIYDVWGDTVNTASRMESHSLPGQIQITDSIYQVIKDKFKVVSRGKIEVKGKGEINTYFITGKS